MLVTPSILTNKAEDAMRQIDRLLPYFSTFQVDIADGIFVPNTTVSVHELHKYIQENNLKDSYTNATFDFHLMVEDYVSAIKEIEHIANLINVGVLMIHSKLRPDLRALAEEFPQFTIGLVINPEETVQIFSTYYTLSEVPFIQIMSVSPGFQGGSFQPDTLNKIDHLKNMDYRFKIYLDGGVNEETLPVIVSRQNPPDVIGPGSYLSKAEDIEARVNELNSLLEGNLP